MATKTRPPKLNVTKNYRLFERNDDNRQLDMKKHKALFASMKLYGFLSSFPISCRRNSSQKLKVKDGQHRLAVAETLGLPIYWIEEPIDFDIALVNCTAKTWVPLDYARKHAVNGKKVYLEGLEFAERHGIPVAKAFSLLGGTTCYNNIRTSFIDGTFKVKDREWAELVARIYTAVVDMSACVRSARFLEACMAVCRVSSFSASRLITNAKRCRDKLIAYSTRDAYLDMLEMIYNYNRSTLVGLKVEAVMAMRDRSAILNKT